MEIERCGGYRTFGPESRGKGVEWDKHRSAWTISIQDNNLSYLGLFKMKINPLLRQKK